MTIETEDAVVAGINVTPLVDITLVLLIIFMVTAHFVEDTGIKVQLPKTATAELNPTPALQVTLGKNGEITLMGRRTELQALKTAMTQEVAANAGVRVVIAADENMAYKNVITILDAIKQCGVARVALSSEKY